jgi:type II secretion system protein J
MTEDRTSKRGVAAFTLIEVLLAVAIFAVVLLAVHTVFYGALKLRNTTTESLQRGIPLQQTLAILKRDLSDLVMPGGTFSGEFQTMVSEIGTSNIVASLSAVDDTMVGQSGPAFFTASGRVDDQAPWGDVQRVWYYLAPPTNNTPGRDLIRSVTRNLLPAFPEEPEEQRLMGGVETLVFSFYDGLQWRQDWDSTIETNKLPHGIKVQIQLARDDATGRLARLPVELVVPVILRVGTNETEQATESEGEEL